MADDFIMPDAPKKPETPPRPGVKRHANGIYFGMPDEEYHRDDALGSSGICDLLISPLTYWSKSLWNPNRPPEAESDSDAKDLGTYIHDMLLRDGAGQFYVEKPEGMSFATKEGKAWRDDPVRDGAIIVSAAQARQQKNVFRGLEAAGVRKLFTGGEPEVSVFWTDKSGVRCKIRIDYLTGAAAYDLKTYQNSMGKDVETAVAHTVANMRISVKAFWYDLGLREMLEMLKRKKYLMVVSGQSDQLVEGLIKMASGTILSWPLWYVFCETGAVPNVTVRRFESHDATTGEIPAYWDWAKNQVLMATHLYALYREKFGMDREWIEPAIMKPFDDTDFGAARWILTEKVG